MANSESVAATIEIESKSLSVKERALQTNQTAEDQSEATSADRRHLLKGAVASMPPSTADTPSTSDCATKSGETLTSNKDSVEPNKKCQPAPRPRDGSKRLEEATQKRMTK